MHVTALPTGDDRRQHRLGLLGLLAGLAIGGTTLLRVAGPPHLPAELPSPAILTSTLYGSYVPPAAIADVLATAAWILWGWLALSIGLRLLVVGAETVTQGALWVRALRRISDRVTLPLVRRLIDGAVVTLVVVNLVARAAPAEAASISPSTVTVTRSSGEAPRPSTGIPAPESSRRAIQYTVQPGDTLWTISERFYGTGFEYGRLVRANAGTMMPNGSRFARTGVIHPGWTIAVPLPSRAIQEAGGRIYYVVEDDDTLRGVAARLLGDEAAWEQIFEANRESARLPGGHTLTRPDLIWPGLRLVLPISSVSGAPNTPSTAPTPVDEVTPSPLPPPDPPTAVESTPAPAATPVNVASPAAVVPQEPAPTPSLTQDPTETVVITPTAPATPVPTDAPTEAIKIDPAIAPAGDRRSVFELVAAGLAVLAAVSGAVLVALRRLRRRLVGPLISAVPEDGPASNEGFAEAELARVLEHRIHGDEVEPAVIVADQATRFFEEHDIDQVDVVTVGQSRSMVSLTIDAGLAVQPRLLELAPELGGRLGGTGEAWRTADHDVLVRVTGLRLAGLTPPVSGRPADAAVLLPVGILPGRETLYANWRDLGHVLVAGLPGGGVEVVLTSLIGALTARCRPDEVRLVTIASRRTLPSPIFALPHQTEVPIDPTDEAAVLDAFQELRSELDLRMQQFRRDSEGESDAVARRSEIVVVIGELEDIQGVDTMLELLAVNGAMHGIRLLAASTRPESLGDEILTHFTTRVALQTLDDDASIRLIGRGDAADLSGGGDLLVRIDGRVPLRARGFRLSPEHLDQLVKVMRETYVGSTSLATVGHDTSGKEIDRGLTKQTDPDSAQLGSRDPEDGRAVKDLDSVCHDRVSVPIRQVHGATPGAASRLNVSHPGLVDSVLPEAEASARASAAIASEKSLPIRVRCFGAFRATSGDRELSATGSDGAHYKSWEILAFLCAQPGETVSRERLLAAMWPDVDTAKAANRLKVSLTRLRKMLTKQVPKLASEIVRVERSGVCRLNSNLISSDVHRFMALRRSASKLRPVEAVKALEEARSLYRGDLLTEPYYEWVHTRADDGLTLREQYREEYFRVTQRLAELHRQQGQPARAVALYRDILKLEPTLEDVARNLYRCYGELGDRGALVREHRRLREAIKQMMSSPDDSEDDPELYEPESETIGLYEEIVADLETRSAVGRTA